MTASREGWFCSNISALYSDGKMMNVGPGCFYSCLYHKNTWTVSQKCTASFIALSNQTHKINLSCNFHHGLGTSAYTRAHAHAHTHTLATTHPISDDSPTDRHTSLYQKDLCLFNLLTVNVPSSTSKQLDCITNSYVPDRSTRAFLDSNFKQCDTAIWWQFESTIIMNKIRKVYTLE
jgi:hypothetical protein